jgi:hypothetical protein
MRRLDQGSGDLFETLEIDAGCVDGGEWQAVDRDEIEKSTCRGQSLGRVRPGLPKSLAMLTVLGMELPHLVLVEESACQGRTMSALSATRANTHVITRLVSSSLSSQYPTYLNGTTTSASQVSPAHAQWRGCRTLPTRAFLVPPATRTSSAQDRSRQQRCVLLRYAAGIQPGDQRRLDLSPSLPVRTGEVRC